MLGTASWERTRVFRNGLVNIASSENGWTSLLIRSFQELRAAGFCSPRCPSILYSACEPLLTSIFQTPKDNPSPCDKGFLIILPGCGKQEIEHSQFTLES
jgi:hypothetical protein